MVSDKIRHLTTSNACANLNPEFLCTSVGSNFAPPGDFRQLSKLGGRRAPDI